MVAYNFMSQFAPKIEDGSKLHTVRANGKRRHARAGEALQLYTGMRQPGCRLLKEVPCIGSWPCHLPVSEANGPLMWSINHQVLSVFHMEQFAKNDGFPDLYAMAEWILNTHGTDFDGTVIAWDWAKYLPSPPLFRGVCDV